jgi:hypothetical protein
MMLIPAIILGIAVLFFAWCYFISLDGVTEAEEKLDPCDREHCGCSDDVTCEECDLIRRQAKTERDIEDLR